MWYIHSTSRGSIDEKGLYKAGAKAGTDIITVMDTANENSLATVEVIVSPRWPMVYDKMWSAKKGEHLFLLRSFRDEVLAENEVGRDYIFMFYNNSLEILNLLLQNPLLTDETKEIIDGLLPGIKTLLKGETTSLSEEQVARIELLFNHFEPKASPQLKKVIEKVIKDLREGILFKQFGITVHK